MPPAPENVVPMNPNEQAKKSEGVSLGTAVFVAVAASIAGAVAVKMLDRFVFKEQAAATQAGAAAGATAGTQAAVAEEARLARAPAPVYIQLPPGQEDEFFARLAGGGYE